MVRLKNSRTFKISYYTVRQTRSFPYLRNAQIKIRIFWFVYFYECWKILWNISEVRFWPKYTKYWSDQLYINAGHGKVTMCRSFPQILSTRSKNTPTFL